MAMNLPNSMFVHIPKCGGRWAKSMLEQHANATHIGDPVYASHETPDTDRPVFCFVREPATFAHSLWHHRAKKKANKFGHKFNWQEYISLERECQSEDYNTFMNNVADSNNAVWDYYQHYVGKYNNVYYARMEHIAEDLVDILGKLGEDVNTSAVLESANQVIGKGTNTDQVEQELRLRINNANAAFCRTFGYPL
jgi:hypothetical protein